MPSLHASPAASLAEECNTARCLIQLLQQEQTHLIEANIESLTRLTEEKAQVIARMSELATQRYRTLASTGFAPQETGMQTWLKSATAEPAAHKTWNTLLTLARSAKELNRTNGLLINQHMTRTQTVLNVLHGNNQTTNFYGPNGQSTSIQASPRSVVVS